MRRAGLDEIRQFLNVLFGQMSLVGPRPFKESESGRSDLSMADLRRLDYLYVSSWSLWWDMKIMSDTPRAMVRGFGAH